MRNGFMFTTFRLRRNQARRLWVERTRELKRSGFAPGTRFTIELDSERRCARLRVAEHGRWQVSTASREGRERPIIDISRQDLTACLGENVERLKVSFSDGEIVVEVHPDEQARQERSERLRRGLARGELTMGTVSTGLGVLDLALHQGFKDLGIKVRHRFGVEIEQRYLDASQRNNPIWSDDTISVLGPMQDIEKGDLPRVDVFAAGIPCVGASRQGKAKNGIKNPEEHATAGALFLAFLNIVRWTNPGVIVLENVPDWAKSVSQGVIRDVLQSWGYRISETLLAGDAFGAIEGRRRWFMVATTEGIDFDIQTIRHQVSPDDAVRLGDVLDDVAEDSPLWKPFDCIWRKAEKDRALGRNFTTPVCDSDTPVIPAIVRNYAKVQSTGVLIRHPSIDGLYRQLTPAEHARGKRIDPALVSGLPNTTAHELLGQSGIFTMFSAIGRAIAEALKGLVPTTRAAVIPVKAVARAIRPTRSAQHKPQLAFAF